MKNQQLNNCIITYINGWDVALRNYDVFESESIYDLVSLVSDNMSPELAKLTAMNTSYFTINLAE